MSAEAPLDPRWHGAADAPVLVLLNSLGTTALMWRRVIEELGERRRILTLEYPGHTVGTEAPRDFASLSLAVASAVAAEGIVDAEVCGISLGGAVGVAVAAARPDLVSRVIAVNAPFRQPSPDFWLARAEAVEAEGLAPFATGLRERWFATGGESALQDALVDSFSEIPPAGYAQMCRVLAPLDLAVIVAGLRAELVIVRGDADCTVGPEQAAAYMKAVPGAQLVEMPGAGHLLAVDQADDLARLIDPPFYERRII